jgi:transposase
VPPQRVHRLVRGWDPAQQILFNAYQSGQQALPQTRDEAQMARQQTEHDIDRSKEKVDPGDGPPVDLGPLSAH